MKVLGFQSIHYGTEYLRESLLSIREHVDKMVVAYTPRPSHGFGTVLTCPDTRDEIYKIAVEVLGDKLIFDEDVYNNESEHRRKAHQYARDYDLILSIDADEVFKEDEIATALNYAYNGTARYYGINGYLNFWRSFNWVCLDGFRPIRIEKLGANNNSQDLNCPLTIYHFSTAQRREIMEYKYKIFGHASEIKTNYLDEVFYKWTPQNNFGDLHPVSINLWNAAPFDRDTLPSYLKEHTNFNKELI